MLSKTELKALIIWAENEIKEWKDFIKQVKRKLNDNKASQKTFKRK